MERWTLEPIGSPKDVMNKGVRRKAKTDCERGVGGEAVKQNLEDNPKIFL